VPFTGTTRWVGELAEQHEQDWKRSDSSWTPWLVNKMVAGYKTMYRSMNPALNSNFVFTTIRGAGHMVPTDRPEAALSLVHMFQTHCMDLSCGSNASLTNAILSEESVIQLNQGESHTLGVNVYGTPSWHENKNLESSLEFVWYHNGSVISKTYTNELSIKSWQIQDAGSYQVDVYDIGGSRVTTLPIEIQIIVQRDGSSSSSNNVFAVSVGTLFGGFVIGIATTLIVESFLTRNRKRSDLDGGGRRGLMNRDRIRFGGGGNNNDYAPPGDEIGMVVVDDDENDAITL